jgi:hypothetical protein
MDMKIGKLKYFKATLAGIFISFNNCLAEFAPLKPINAAAVNFPRFSMFKIGILFTSYPLTQFCASFLCRLAHFIAGIRRVLSSGEIMAVNVFVPFSSVKAGDRKAATTSTQRRGFLWCFLGLVETFRGAEVQVFNAGGGLKKLLPAIVTDYGDGSLPSLALASGRAI